MPSFGNVVFQRALLCVLKWRSTCFDCSILSNMGLLHSSYWITLKLKVAPGLLEPKAGWKATAASRGQSRPDGKIGKIKLIKLKLWSHRYTYSNATTQKSFSQVTLIRVSLWQRYALMWQSADVLCPCVSACVSTSSSTFVRIMEL